MSIRRIVSVLMAGLQLLVLAACGESGDSTMLT